MTFDPADHDAVVYDLDGTLVELDVDWSLVASDVLDVYAETAIKPPGTGLWELLGAAEEYGIAEAVEETIATHEREGARSSTRLPVADLLRDGNDTGPVAVCSLNCESACRIALSTHRLDDAVDAVVGRDTVATYKPNPEPLLAALDALGVDPARAAFIGDTERDALTAERAGVPFVWAGDVRSR